VAIALAGLLGLLLGGALNLLIQRLPRTRPLLGRPHCLRCGQPLSWEAIPLLGYLLQRGRCRHCHAPLALCCPAVEVLTAATWAALVWQHGVSWLALLYGLFSLALIVTLFLDWLRHEIYYLVLLPATALALLAPLLPIDPRLGFLSSLLGLVAGLVFFGVLFALGHLLFRIEALALGDVWLAGMIGAMAGFYGSLLALTGGIVLAAAGAGLLLLTRRLGPKDYMPYGTFLCLAALLYLCFWAP
jgi:leader peptidase (prepilin peptidase)/N-methyltransferase